MALPQGDIGLGTDVHGLVGEEAIAQIAGSSRARSAGLSGRPRRRSCGSWCGSPGKLRTTRLFPPVQLLRVPEDTASSSIFSRFGPTTMPVALPTSPSAW